MLCPGAAALFLPSLFQSNAVPSACLVAQQPTFPPTYEPTQTREPNLTRQGQHWEGGQEPPAAGNAFPTQADTAMRATAHPAAPMVGGATRNSNSPEPPPTQANTKRAVTAHPAAPVVGGPTAAHDAPDILADTKCQQPTMPPTYRPTPRRDQQPTQLPPRKTLQQWEPQPTQQVQ